MAMPACLYKQHSKSRLMGDACLKKCPFWKPAHGVNPHTGHQQQGAQQSQTQEFWKQGPKRGVPHDRYEDHVRCPPKNSSSGSPYLRLKASRTMVW